MRTLILTLALALPGCIAELPGADAPDAEAQPPASPATAAPAAPPAPAATCAPALQWRAPGPAGFGGHGLLMAPGGDLLLRADQFGVGVLRVRDGAWASERRAPGSQALDAGWTRTVQVDPEGAVSVVALPSGEEELRVPRTLGDPALSVVQTRAVLTPDGAQVLALDCWLTPARTVTGTLRILDVETGDARLAASSAACTTAWARRPTVAFDPAGRTAIIAALGSRGIEVVDLDTGRVRRVEDVVGPPAEPVAGVAHVGLPEESGVLAMAVSPDGRMVVVVGVDGLLHRLDPATLAPVAAPLPVGLVVANGGSYLPSLESPLAFSPAGDQLAHVAPDGRVVIRDAATDAVVATLEGGFPEEPEAWGSAPNVPMAISWTPHGLAVSFEGGVVLWGCPVEAPLDDTLTVSVEGPALITVGQTVTYTVRVEGAAGPVFRQVAVGPAGAAGLGERLALRPYEPGTYTLVAEADDGRGTGATTLPVTVLPAP